jgi:Protein of unknown function (DUF3455)
MARVKRLVCGIAAAMLIGTGGFAAGADQAAVAPPAGSALVLELFADGVQIYTCDPKDGVGYGWTFNAPDAKLFDKEGRQVGTHFTGPAWNLDDGSGVTGEVVAKADAPETGAIQWLLLRVKSHQGAGALSAVSYIRRADTKGGVAPKAGCDAQHLSEQVRMRYSATYQFYSAPK